MKKVHSYNFLQQQNGGMEEGYWGHPNQRTEQTKAGAETGVVHRWEAAKGLQEGEQCLRKRRWWWVGRSPEETRGWAEQQQLSRTVKQPLGLGGEASKGHARRCFRGINQSLSCVETEIARGDGNRCEGWHESFHFILCCMWRGLTTEDEHGMRTGGRTEAPQGSWLPTEVVAERSRHE